VPFRCLRRVIPDRGPELGQQVEGALRRFCLQGQGDLLQAEVEQAQGCLPGAGQPAGTGIVEQGLGVAPQRGLGQGSGVKQLHVLPRAGIEALQIADGIPRRLQFSLVEQGGSGLQLGYPEQRQCHYESH